MPCRFSPNENSRVKVVLEVRLLESIFASCSETSSNFDSKSGFTVLGFLPICFSNDELRSLFFPIRSVYRIPDNSHWPLLLLFLHSRVGVLILPLPLWSRTGQVNCSIPNCYKIWRTLQLQKVCRDLTFLLGYAIF